MESSQMDAGEASGACSTFDGYQRRGACVSAGTALEHAYLQWNERESAALQPNYGSVYNLAALRECPSTLVPGVEDSTAAFGPFQTSEPYLLNEWDFQGPLDDQLLNWHLGTELDITDHIYVAILEDQLLGPRVRAQSGMTGRASDFADQVLDSHRTHLGKESQMTASAQIVEDKLLHCQLGTKSDTIANNQITEDQLLDFHHEGGSDMADYAQILENQLLDSQLGTTPDITSSELEESAISGCAQGADHDNEEVLEKDEQVDLELEKYLIVKTMLGDKFSVAMDPSFEAFLDFQVDVFKSFRTGVPQHCSLQCPLTNEPASCCWNDRFRQSKSNIKSTFQRDITLILIDYLKKEGKKLCSLPPHCTAALRKWTTANQKDPYMSKEKASKMAEELGVTLTQIDYWLENWRVRKWKPVPVGQKGRKGKHFRHPEEETSKLKSVLSSLDEVNYGNHLHAMRSMDAFPRRWILEMARHPTQEESETLSQGSSMTPDQIRMWCCNYRKRHKNLFAKWR